MQVHSAVLAAVLVLFAVPQAHAQAPKTGGTLTFAVSAEPPNYDCHAQSSFAFIHPVRPHYSTLLKFDTASYPKVVGDLAESWTVAPDGLTYTFRLKRNVKFHDGSALTSEDIKATYDKYAQTREVLPAMGYSDEQISELEQTINSAPVDTVVIGTPIDLRRVLKLDKPAVRVRYELAEKGTPNLETILREKFAEALAGAK